MTDDQSPVIDALHEAQTNGQSVALATIVNTQGSIPRHAGSKMLIYPDGRIVGTVGGGAMESKVVEAGLHALETGQCELITYQLNNIDAGDPGVCGGSAQIFIEPIGIRVTLLVIGAGHVGAALADLGKWMGLRVILCDDREDLCSPESVPGLDDYVLCNPAAILEHITITPHTYIAAVTRGLPIDINILPILLKTPAPYIGVIGSRRRWAITVKALKDDHNLSEAQLERIHAPIGLEIEAETPKEIALSILSEIVMVRRSGTGKPMKWIGSVQESI